MYRYHAQPSPYRVRREGQKIILDNEYTCWVHDLDQGGELSEAVVKNGSNQNLLVAPQSFSVAIQSKDGLSQQCFSSLRKPPTQCDVQEMEDGVHLKMKQLLVDEKGDVLEGATLEHHVRYSPWGYGYHTVHVHFSSEVKNVCQVQTGSLFVRRDMDRCGLRGNSSLSHFANGPKGMGKWVPLYGGRKVSDNPAVWNSVLPLSAMMIKRGMEGVELALGDDLVDWERIGGGPGHQQFYLGYNPRQEGYEVRFCPFDTPSRRFPSCELSGSYTFEFRVALPYVKPRMLSLFPTGGNFVNVDGPLEDRWPDTSAMRTWKNAGVQLMRLHNDGDKRSDGIFWRATDYPPYPPDEMKKMDDALAQAREAGIHVVPYFSPLEYHPETEGFEANSQEWFRMCRPGAKIEHNYTRYCGEFGAMMCLESDWLEKRKETVEVVLKNHAFSGMYYDHCCGLECYHPSHSRGKGHHWSHQRLQNLLEWSHKTAGPDGDLFLHMTNNENFAAENLATLAVTEELHFGGVFGPEIFTPLVHFMNTTPRLVCDRMPNPTPENQRKFGLCAILNHAGVLSSADPYIKLAQKDMKDVDVCRYQRHSVQGEGICQSTHPDTGASIYWNGDEALVLVANLSEKSVETEWAADGKAMGLGRKVSFGGRVLLGPLELRKVSMWAQNEKEPGGSIRSRNSLTSSRLEFQTV